MAATETASDTPEWLSWRAEASGPYAAWVWETTSSLSEP